MKQDLFIDCILTSQASLVSKSERNAERLRLHIEDSLSALQLGRNPAHTIIDIGSGAGFPALPLAIALPQASVICVESVRRKAQFLRETAKTLDLQEQIEVVNDRIETVTRPGMRLREHGDWVTLRAVADPVIAMEYGAPAVSLGGTLMLYCTAAQYRDTTTRLQQAATILGLDSPQSHKVTNHLRSDAVIVTALRTQPCPNGYPRRIGLARARPLA